MKAGGCGVVSVAYNIIPKVVADLVQAMLEGNEAEAQKLNDQYTPLFNGFLTLDTNPAPIKAALEIAGVCSGRLRLPMVPMTDDKITQLKSILKDLSIA